MAVKAQSQLTMCGIAAYAGNHPFEPKVAEEVIRLAATRGPHSHGLAVSQFLARGEGDATGAIEYLTGLAEEQRFRFLVHSRLATTGLTAGGAPEVGDTMPFVVGDYAVVHNGNVPAYRQIASQHDFTLETDCDSEVLAHLIAMYGERYEPLPISVILSMVVERVDNGRPFVLVAMHLQEGMAAMRRDLPLYMLSRREGMYLCSREPEAKGEKMLIPEMTAVGWPNTVIRK